MIDQVLALRSIFFHDGPGSQLSEGVDGVSVAELNLPGFGRATDLQEQERKASSQPLGTAELLSSSKEGRDSPICAGESLPVIPAKLVKKILRGDYEDMADLLKDNLEAEWCRYSQEWKDGQPQFGQLPCYRREVPDMLSWLNCFSLYAAVITGKYPYKARELGAYQAMMVSEQRRCRGRGWLLYDSGFRQQILSLEETDFSKLNQSLYTTTFLAYGGRGQFCPCCLSSDHLPEDCALHPQRAVPVVCFRESGASAWDDWRMKSGEWRRKRPRRGACFAWNDGKCVSPYCQFEHVCSRCFGDHKQMVCN